MNPKKRILNIRIPQVFLRLGLLFVVGGLGACQHGLSRPDSKGGSEDSGNAEDHEILFWQNRKKLVKEAELYRVFESALHPKADRFEVFQVVCDGASGCSFLLQPGSGKTSSPRKLDRVQSDKLFNLLVNLPVSKGETGAAVDYISCRRFKEAPVTPWRYHCSVATPVGLIPHTSLPISELAD